MYPIMKFFNVQKNANCAVYKYKQFEIKNSKNIKAFKFEFANTNINCFSHYEVF